MAIKTIEEFSMAEKRILVRVDFNVPIDGSGAILDDFRIRESLPTLQYLLSHRAKIILISHLGDPKGIAIPNLALDKVGKRLEELLGIPVKKASDCIGPEVKNQALGLRSGDILLLENVRFHKEETDNDPEFAKELSSIGEAYINDAFSVCHRAHASVVGIPLHLPSATGLLLKKEIENLGAVLKNPKKPLVVVVGGKKAATKAGFINNMVKSADVILVSGLIKKEMIEQKLEINDAVVGPENNLDALDIDAETIKIFREKILTAKTVVWNGSFGKFEDERYKNGTLQIANAIIESGAFSVVGGGETIEFLSREGMLSKFNHVSTGGGAMLSYLAGEELPGLRALENPN